LSLSGLCCFRIESILRYLAKLGFQFKIKAPVKILPQAYKEYFEDKIFTHNKDLGRKDNFSRQP
jgi:hypothetical protein